MSLDKSILHHKEHRKAYGKSRGTYAKSVDQNCRNHGSCSWCRGNRLYNSNRKEYAMIEAIKEIEKESDNLS